jgi:hypothetical protein
MNKKNVIGKDALRWVGQGSEDKNQETPVPAEEVSLAEEASPAARVRRFTLHLPETIIETLRNAAWYDRVTIRSIVEGALAKHLQTLELERGEEYPDRVAV